MKKESKTAKKLRIGQILRQFWGGVRPVKGMFFCAYFLFLISQIISVYVPLYYKKFFDVISSSSDNISTAAVLVKIIITVFILRFSVWVIYRIGIFIWNTVESSVMAILK